MKRPLRSDNISWDLFIASIMSVWRRNYMVFRHTWKSSLLWIWVEPLFLLLALGYGVGSFVPQIDGHSYIDFLLPGLMANTAMLVSFLVTTNQAYNKLHPHGTYANQILTALEPREVLIGEIFWAASKGWLSAFGVLLLSIALGASSWFSFVPLALVLVLISLFYASLGMLCVSVARSPEQILFVTSGIIVPMSLIGGSYFPLSLLPNWLHYLLYLLPQTHAVAASRAIFLEDWSFTIALHVVSVLAFLLISWRLSLPRFYARLFS